MNFNYEGWLANRATDDEPENWYDPFDDDARYENYREAA